MWAIFVWAYTWLRQKYLYFLNSTEIVGKWIKHLSVMYYIQRELFDYTEPSYSNESYDSVSRKPLDGFQNALHNKHIFIFGEGLITNMSLDITIYSTLLINLSFFMHCFFHNTNYHSSESCS